MTKNAAAALGLAIVLVVTGQSRSKAGEPPAQAAARLAEQLKRHPARPSKGPYRRALFLLDLKSGEATMIADEPDPGADSCGSPRWSHDGRRILFDAMPNMQFQLLHIKAIELGENEPRMTDLGFGARPTFSPDDSRIAFLLHEDAIPGATPGIWVMQADGSQRRRAGYYGMPFWSADDRQFLIVSFNDPRELRLVNIEREESQIIAVPGHGVFGWPSWADAGTVAAIIGAQGRGDTVTLLDVKNPTQVSIKQVLWKQGQGMKARPLWPVHSPVTRRTVFVGVEPEGMALYVIEPGRAGQPKRLEKNGLDTQIGGLCFSPDGRFLLFCSSRGK